LVSCCFSSFAILWLVFLFLDRHTNHWILKSLWSQKVETLKASLWIHYNHRNHLSGNSIFHFTSLSESYCRIPFIFGFLLFGWPRNRFSHSWNMWFWKATFQRLSTTFHNLCCPFNSSIALCFVFDDTRIFLFV